ncbi:Chitin synthase [Drechslerella dactyloides]|uniref:chitin synthase n=1 Tax=Drechslerella dactyloides TaxID=74499 RepID=A0AAD6ITB8_DREDA|nr:Chitin synthase [Drechslerella dactyloides]
MRFWWHWRGSELTTTSRSRKISCCKGFCPPPPPPYELEPPESAKMTTIDKTKLAILFLLAACALGVAVTSGAWQRFGGGGGLGGVLGPGLLQGVPNLLLFIGRRFWRLGQAIKADLGFGKAHLQALEALEMGLPAGGMATPPEPQDAQSPQHPWTCCVIDSNVLHSPTISRRGHQMVIFYEGFERTAQEAPQFSNEAPPQWQEQDLELKQLQGVVVEEPEPEPSAAPLSPSPSVTTRASATRNAAGRPSLERGHIYHSGEGYVARDDGQLEGLEDDRHAHSCSMLIKSILQQEREVIEEEEGLLDDFVPPPPYCTKSSNCELSKMPPTLALEVPFYIFYAISGAGLLTWGVKSKQGAEWTDWVPLAVFGPEVESYQSNLDMALANESRLVVDMGVAHHHHPQPPRTRRKSCRLVATIDPSRLATREEGREGGVGDIWVQRGGEQGGRSGRGGGVATGILVFLAAAAVLVNCGVVARAECYDTSGRGRKRGENWTKRHDAGGGGGSPERGAAMAAGACEAAERGEFGQRVGRCPHLSPPSLPASTSPPSSSIFLPAPAKSQVNAVARFHHQLTSTTITVRYPSTMTTPSDEGLPSNLNLGDRPSLRPSHIEFTAGDVSADIPPRPRSRVEVDAISGELTCASVVTQIAFLVLGSWIYLAILVEWVAWLLAFLYCFYHCLVKAIRSKDYTKIFLTVIITTLFTALRLFFIPVLIVSIPLPAALRARLPDSWATLLELIAFYAFVVLLLFPASIIIFNMFNRTIGRKALYASLLTDDAPKIAIIMPCYNELAENVMKCINSIAGQDYPMSCLHVCLSFDSDEVNKEYLEVLNRLGVPTVRKNKYPVSIDVRFQGMRVTVSRYKHGGKRHTQKKTFQMIDKLYEKYLERRDDVYLLFIDSDCVLDRYCVQNFMYDMDFIPRQKNKRQPMAMTGVITSRVDKGHASFITLLQDMEYIHGQLFERAVESSCGAVTCLPGALTCLKFSAFRNMSTFYFADMADKHDNPFDYGQYHLGEDRWLTHLFMIGAKHSYQIGFSTSAFCKTEACSTWNSLINQRTRWFKGFITNEAAMLTDWQLWKRYPLLCIFLVLSLMTKVQTVVNLPLPLIALSLGANWFFMLWYGWQLKRKKAYLYPILFLANPVINWFYLVASVWTYKRRSWGGPRVKRIGRVVEDSEEDSDGLPELSDRERDAIRQAALPWRTLSGRFVPAQVDEDGFYHRSDLNLPLSGRSSVALPQLVTSDAASVTTRNSEIYLGDLLAPPPLPRNRMSGYSMYSYDSEVGRLYAPAQTFLRSDLEDIVDVEASRYYTPASFEDYPMHMPVAAEDLYQQPPNGLDFQLQCRDSGDLGEMTMSQINEAHYDDCLPHAISDNTPMEYRHSFDDSIDILYPPSTHRLDAPNRPGSPDSWTRDDDAAFSAAGNERSSKNPFDTPPSAQSVEGGSSKRGKGKLWKKKKPESMEIGEPLERGKKGGFFGFLKRY